MNMPSTCEEVPMSSQKVGTLAIDLGNSTTVVAFQGEQDRAPSLIDLPPISSLKGQIPSLLCYRNGDPKRLLIGQQVLDLGLSGELSPNLVSDFKRWIGAPIPSEAHKTSLLPEEAGEIFIREIWQKIPSYLKVKRLVLTAPVETYRAYRAWLHKVCSTLPVDEIALLDESTAAAMGADLSPGSKLLVVDIGASTIDLSLVALEGGEGRPEPIAQLLRFNGQDLEGQSNQVLRCAKVLGKAGIRLGGRDFDRWIANYLFPECPITESLLNAAERLKCRLSNNDVQDTDILFEAYRGQSDSNSKNLYLSRRQLEKLLTEKGFLSVLTELLNQTLARGRANGCSLQNLKGVVAVGGGARIPLLRRWLKENIKPAQLITPPPIEAVAIGALKLTPGVEVKDVLQRGVSLRCWEQRSGRHIWHPLFMPGQTWPTRNAFEIILAASKVNQKEIELVIGEPDVTGAHEVVYIEGIPTVKQKNNESRVNSWQERPETILLNPPGQPGQDCVLLKFSITDDSKLQMQGVDLRSGKMLQNKVLGPVR